MSDFPDWFGQPQFPRYGGAVEASNNLNAVANDTVSVVSIEKKGILYHAEFNASGDNSSRNDIVYIYFDGIEFFQITPRTAIQYGMIYPVVGMWHIVRYDLVDSIFRLFFTGKVSFDTSVEIKYKEQFGNTPSLVGDIRYSAIE